MDLYFSPLACSLASRISLAEASIDANYIEVDPLTKSAEGKDFRDINPLGLVPVLRLDDGAVLTENASILQHITELAPDILMPAGKLATARLRQWLSFIGTELHSSMFSSLFDDKASDDVKTYAVGRGARRLGYLDNHLRDREFLLDRFTVADAYLLTILNWVQATPVDLAPYPAIAAYLEKGHQRPTVQAAIALELPLYLAERERKKAS